MKSIKIKLVTPTDSKLAFVKLIKECSGLGLKESKELCDSLHDFPNKSFEMPIREWELLNFSPAKIDYEKKFIDDIKKINGEFIVNSSKQYDREIKFLKLGIANSSDYSEFISEYILNVDNGKDILKSVLEQLSKEDLKNIFNKLKLD
jgi:hypothetical protein